MDSQNEAGQLAEQRHYDAWGNFTHLKRDGVLLKGSQLDGILSLLIDRGYTSHEHLYGVKLIHMNGRLYDPLLRRFLNADENIQDPENTQIYNKYGYVANNPLMFNDPSGEIFGFDDLTIGAVILIGALIGAASYTLGVLISTGSLRQWNIFDFAKSVIIGGISAAVTFGIGELFSGAGSALITAKDFGNALLQAGLHGVSQGFFALVDNGGNFFQGFLSGSLGSFASNGWTSMIGSKAASSAVGMIAFGALSGGVGATLSGGNFFKGFVQGGVVAALNHGLHSSLQKKSDYLVYDGDEIIWYDGNGKVVARFPATSGVPGYQNSANQSIPDAGPVPEGSYTVDLSLDPYRYVEINQKDGATIPGKGIQQIPYRFQTSNGSTYSYEGWGTVRARLNPSKGTNTFGRSNFYLHDSHKGYYHGCIEVGQGFFSKLIDYSKTNSYIKVIVNYPTMNSSTTGRTFY